jgi:hypothetical protein
MALNRAHTLVAFVLIIRAEAAAVVRDRATSCRRSNLPGEYPQHRFRSPFPRLAGERQELRDKYLFGDWLGVRTKLAEHGINLTGLFIT